jgi:glutamine amidotransferase
MSRLFGYFSDHAGPVADALRLAGLATALGTVARPLAIGLGFSHGTQILLKRRPNVADGDVDLAGMAQDVRTNALVVHARGSVGPTWALDDTQPFRYGPWMYAGSEADRPTPPAAQEAARRALPDSLAHNVRGQTESELFFHLVLSHLRDAGVPPNAWAAPANKVLGAVRSALTHWRTLSREAGEPKPTTLVALLSNGQTFYALSSGAPLYFAGVKRVRGELVRADAHEARGFVFLGGIAPPDENSWGVVETGSAVWFDDTLRINRAGIEP